MSTSNKSCSVCEEVKPITDFYVNKKGVLSKGCVVCVRNPAHSSRYSLKAQANYAAHVEKHNYLAAEKKDKLDSIFHGR